MVPQLDVGSPECVSGEITLRAVLFFVLVELPSLSSLRPATLIATWLVAYHPLAAPHRETHLTPEASPGVRGPSRNVDLGVSDERNRRREGP